MSRRIAFRYSFTPWVVTLVIFVCTHAAFAQTSGFTYQGKLTDGGTSANGNYDLQFALFDSLNAGSQVGSTQTLNAVAVSNGVFKVSLDFGASAFNGANRFLEIGARPSGSGSFTTLSPRQQITSTPYAVRSLNSASADSVPASGVPAGSGNYIQNSSSPQGSSNFNISGNGTAGGTLSGGVVNATTQYNINGIRILSSPGSQNLFAGNGAGSANTTGTFNAFFGEQAGEANKDGNSNSFFGGFAGAANTAGTSNSFFGLNAGSENTNGSANTFIGAGAGALTNAGDKNTIIGAGGDFVNGSNPTNATAIGYNARVGASNSLVLGSIAGFNGGPDTNVGIGTPTPQRKLHIRGVGADGFAVGDLLVTGTGSVGSSIALEATGSGGRKFSWLSTASGADAGGGALAAFDATAGAYRIVINSAGNVGIATTGPLDKLHVSGDIRVGTTGTNGCLKNNNGGTIVGTCSSDARFKRDIRPFSNLLNRVTQLQPVHFYWRASEFPEKGFGDAQNYGLVAQDVERALPELVSNDAEGFKQVDYSKLPLLLLQAVKEQQAQIQQQQKLIERQQALAVRQQQQLNALKRLACRSRRRVGVCQ